MGARRGVPTRPCGIDATPASSLVSLGRGTSAQTRLLGVRHLREVLMSYLAQNEKTRMSFWRMICKLINTFLCKSGNLKVKKTVGYCQTRTSRGPQSPEAAPGLRKRLDSELGFAAHGQRLRDSVSPSVKLAVWTRQVLGYRSL